MDPADADAFAEYLSSLPVTGWAVAAFSELLGGFLGGLTAGWIARDQARGFSGALVGLALLGSIVNWTSFTHPTWFIVSQLIGYTIALMGAWALLGMRSPSADS
jgi:hypothetical protein